MSAHTHVHNCSHMVAERGTRPPLERILERICKQIVDIHVLQVVGQVTGVPKTPSRDRILQCTVDQIFDVLVPEMIKQLMEVPKTTSQDRIQQQTVEQIVDTPALSITENVVEMPVTQTQEKMQQVANTHVQHVVNTIKVEKPKIFKPTVQKPVIQEKINQVIKPIKVPQFLNEAVDMLDAVQRQVSMVQKIQKIIETSQLQIVGEIVRDSQTSDSLGTTPVCQVAQTGHVEVVEIETSLPTESASAMFVSTPVPQAVEELVEGSKVFSQNRVQQRFGKQTIEPPAISLAERVVEAPDTRTRDKTQHVVNTHVQHVVNTVEADAHHH